MTIYRNGVAQPNPDPALVGLLRDHRWNALTEGCSCGWTQREGLGRRHAQHNHHIHQAAAITSEVVRVSLQFAEQLVDEPMGQELERLQEVERQRDKLIARTRELENRANLVAGIAQHQPDGQGQFRAAVFILTGSWLGEEAP